jgi:hypothetical protein
MQLRLALHAANLGGRHSLNASLCAAKLNLCIASLSRASICNRVDSLREAIPSFSLAVVDRGLARRSISTDALESVPGRLVKASNTSS